ncbi:hypothetical protein QEZ54_20505 [Catellatospora sp. KI3]|uniref:hypothetical protein n=1 Tax=Catellatospora sp. KI3 TaxID=3041620 RepID=UPI002482DDAE|nr:hypothetical protein [Catellatospora sp. KI3]MDI1463368.1 hypothetical protein [Catellatospora sp. KI3]
MTSPRIATADDDSPHDVVGNRILIGVQMVNISRLSTHPVPIIANGLITVAGQGPTDSNGAGKSSFIAGLSLLHADDQWRLQSGAQAAAELLFTAELAGQEAMHANADRGYIVGVFAPPAADTIDDLEAGVLTVWLRINRQSPHVEVRWVQRLHLPYGETENERAAGADTLWNALPKSNGRTDIRANRLAKTLYGDTVRCVSFLSTSVRASLTANLLAQPLNELSPEKIFDAIGALTGLTGELEQEQKARSQEHNHAATAQQAREQYDEWDTRMSVVERGINSRQHARTLLDEARDCWRSRCARHLLDGITEYEDITSDLKNNEQTRKDLEPVIAKAKADLGRLTDDKALERSYRERVERFQQIKAELDVLRVDHSNTIGQLEALAGRKRELELKAQAADGMTVEEAAQARRQAESDLSSAQQARGVTIAALAAANRALAAAERGEDVSSAQVRMLRAVPIDAVPLVDVVSLTEAQRAVWEARLLPYRHAIVVAHEHAAHAAKILAGLPGSLVVGADGPDSTPDRGADLPATNHESFALNAFLGCLAQRAGTEPTHIDTAAGVRAVNGFAEPLTGRAGRIRAARAAVQTAAEADQKAEAAVTVSQQKFDRAQVRCDAAQAGVDAAEIGARIAKLRSRNDDNENAQRLLAAPLAAATEAHQQAVQEKAARELRIAAVRHQVTSAERERSEAITRWEDLTSRRDGLDLPERHAAWGATAEAARRHLLELDEQKQRMPQSDWDDAADSLAGQVRDACFPLGTPAEQLPEELRIVDEQRRSRRSHDRIRLIPPLLRIVSTHLDQYSQVDKQQKAEIERQRTDKTATLRSAEAALEEARQASEALRATIAAAIKAKLKQVSSEFDRIDKAYGGYGGGLDFPEPEPPADPDKAWRWSVTPKWRRGEGKSPASYRLRGNTAQMDDKAVKLVCAAALAGTGDRPLLLVLDELGRNLGAAHRRDAVALFENIGRDRSISVVGALQDDMERYAVAASSLYIKLRRTSDTMPYNQAPVVIGSEPNQARVGLLTEWMISYRPEPQT